MSDQFVTDRFDTYGHRLTFLKALRGMDPAAARASVVSAAHPAVGLITEREAWLLLLVFAPEVS